MILIIMPGVKLNEGQLCLSSENKRWKPNRKKCVECSPCPSGKARNFTESYVGPSVPEGDTRCLKCRDCPEGFYAGENGCQPCRVLCDVDYNRDFDEICEEFHDAECGSCLYGYEDTYRNSKYPCSLKHSASIVNGHELNTGDPVYSSSKHSADVDLEDKPVVKDETPFPVVQATVTIAALLVLAIFIFFLLICFIKKRRREAKRKAGDIESTEEDIELQTDGEGDNTQNMSEMVAGDDHRLGRTVPLSFPSSHPIIGGNTQSRRACGYRYASVPLTELTSLSCGCHNNPDCQCYISDLPNTEIQKNDTYILTVSTSICHCPDRLYEALKLDHTEIYPVQNDREIDPVKTTFQDKNLRLLNRWVEKQSTSVNLNTLMKALCVSGFHKINHKLKEK